MRFSNLCLLALTATTTLMVKNVAAEETCMEAPYISPRVLMHGSVISEVDNFVTSKVLACCSNNNNNSDDDDDKANFRLEEIGEMPQMSTEQSMTVLQDAKEAWDGGMGVWPQMSLRQRVDAILHFLKELAPQRERIVATLMWEIGKNRKDAESEFDRTVSFVEQVNTSYKTMIFWSSPKSNMLTMINIVS
jgi:acyl-CoA reductase-like NAD-dependent aldehyde dehydrogenase